MMGMFKRQLTAAQEARHEEARTAADDLIRDLTLPWDISIIHPVDIGRLPRPVVFRTTEGEA